MPNYNLLATFSPTDQTIVDAFGHVDTQVNQVSLLDRPLYDRITYAATNVIDENSSKFFSSRQGKNLRDTNMPKESELPNPDMFRIMGIGFYLPPTTAAADAEAILDSLSLVIAIRSTTLFESPLHRLVAGGGLQFSGTAAANKVYINNGTPGRQAAHIMDWPIVIPPLTTYSVYLKGTPVTCSAQVRPEVVLNGWWLKGV